MAWLRGYKPERLIGAVLIAVYGLGFVLNRDTTLVSFWHNFALAIHESGHYFVFAWAPEFLNILGGSLMQCVFPLIFVGYFWRIGQRYAASVTLFWAAFNLIDTAVYIADARAQALPLLGGDNSIHDWNYLLGATNTLNSDTLIAGIVHVLGALFYALSVAGGVWFAKGDDRPWWWQRDSDPLDQPVARLRNIGARSAALLERIGIATRGDLVQIGALEAYRQLVAVGAHPSLSLLYALHGAITDRDWNKLGDKEKSYLREEAAALEGPTVEDRH